MKVLPATYCWYSLGMALCTECSHLRIGPITLQLTPPPPPLWISCIYPQNEQNVEEIEAKVAILREALPQVEIDRLVTAHPSEVLSVESFLVSATPA